MSTAADANRYARIKSIRATPVEQRTPIDQAWLDSRDAISARAITRRAERLKAIRAKPRDERTDDEQAVLDARNAETASSARRRRARARARTPEQGMSGDEPIAFARGTPARIDHERKVARIAESLVRRILGEIPD